MLQISQQRFWAFPCYDCMHASTYHNRSHDPPVRVFLAQRFPLRLPAACLEPLLAHVILRAQPDAYPEPSLLCTLKICQVGSLHSRFSLPSEAHWKYSIIITEATQLKSRLATKKTIALKHLPNFFRLHYFGNTLAKMPGEL